MEKTKHQSTFDFLQEIDDELTVYSDRLIAKSFTTTKYLKVLQEEDLEFAQPAHRRLILAHTRKLAEEDE